jgi:hypothetical protein
MVGNCQTAGKPLYWGASCISFSVNSAGSHAVHNGSENVITATELESIVRKSYDNWQNVGCTGGGHPNISVETYPQVECAEVRYNKKDVNQNLWVFRDAAWPHDDPTGSTIALTSVIFNPDTGEIYDADVELNSYAVDFDLETVGSGTDLQSVVQHESGHVLGLAHSDDMSATMYTSYSGRSDMRTLEQDDTNGICTAYPPGTATNCDAEPRHGFSTQCTDPGDGGCSVRRVGRSAPWYGGAGILVALFALLRRGGRRGARSSS